MAFIPEEEEGSQEVGMNTLATQDQLNQQQSQEDQEQQVGQGTPVSISAGQPQIGSQVAPQSTPATGTRKQKGSGMFTDIRKYISANKPAAERISGAVTGKVGQQAQDIKNQIQKQQDKLQQNLDQTQSRLQESREFTQEAIQKAGSGELSDEDFQRFQGLITNGSQFDVAQPVDLLQQRSRAKALERLSSQAGRAQGREELLRQTFSGRGRPYTRGQRAVDSLILSADPTATQQMVQGTQQQLGGLADSITQARKKAIQDVYGLKKDVSEFTGREGEAAQSILGEQGARTTLGQELDQQAATELQKLTDRRQELLNKLQKRQFLTKEEFDELGVAEGLQGTLQGFLTATGGVPKEVDFSQYLDVIDPKNFNRQTIASAEDRARFDALSKLVGQEGLGDSTAQAALRFNAETAIKDVLDRMNRGDLNVTEQGITGKQEAINAFQTALLAANPFMAATLFGVSDFQDKLAQNTGVDLGGAQAAIGQEILNLPDTMKEGLSPEQLLISGGPTGALLSSADDALTRTEQALTPDLQGAVGSDLQNLGAAGESLFTVNPFNLVGNTIKSGENIIKTAEQIASAVGGNITGNENIDRVIAGLATGGMTEAVNVASNIASEAKRAAEKAKNVVKSIFCFMKGTSVKMEDGSIKNIEDIDLGESLYLGGKVTATGKAIAYGEIYKYKGSFVTSYHAVFENGKWLRVEDSEHAELTNLSPESIVYPLNTENHLMVVNNFIAADFQETDDEWISEDQKIENLNSNIDRNNWLLEEEYKLQGE